MTEYVIWLDDGTTRYFVQATGNASAPISLVSCPDDATLYEDRELAELMSDIFGGRAIVSTQAAVKDRKAHAYLVKIDNGRYLFSDPSYQPTHLQTTSITYATRFSAKEATTALILLGRGCRRVGRVVGVRRKSTKSGIFYLKRANGSYLMRPLCAESGRQPTSYTVDVTEALRFGSYQEAYEASRGLLAQSCRVVRRKA